MLKIAEPLIYKIASQRKRNNTFAHYTDDDIEQEVWVMCLDALHRYDPSIGPLENFLNNHVANRLKNLKRDKYFRPGHCPVSSGAAKIRMNLINALPLDGGDIPQNSVILGTSFVESNPFENLLAQDTHDYIVNKLSPELKPIFYSVINGNKVRKPILENLREAIAKILKERGDDG